MDLSASVRKPLEASNAAIERAMAAIAKAPKKGNVDVLRALEDAQSAIDMVLVQQDLVAVQLDAVAKAGLKLQQEKASLETEKASLLADKADLEKRERIWSPGFLAALLTALVALASVIGKFPMLRLDMQLKRLEIKEKELALEGKATEKRTEA